MFMMANACRRCSTDQGMTSAAQDGEDADLVVLNTCHIREKAAEKVYSDIGRLQQKATAAVP